MNRTGLMISLTVSMIICSFITGLVAIYWSTLQYHAFHVAWLGVSLEDVVKTWFTLYAYQIYLITFPPCVGITYYMITD